MLLTAMLKRELIKELKALSLSDTALTYKNQSVLSEKIGVDVYSLEHFISSKDNEGMIHVDFLNLLFERYRDKIINPVKSSAVAIQQIEAEYDTDKYITNDNSTDD